VRLRLLAITFSIVVLSGGERGKRFKVRHLNQNGRNWVAMFQCKSLEPEKENPGKRRFGSVKKKAPLYGICGRSETA
jgi:hypothetical protein